MTPHRLHQLDRGMIEALADILIDCVEGGASVGFMLPISRERALAFWNQIARDVAERRRILLVAEDDEGPCGTVQLVVDLPDNQPHRADLVKMLVHRRARKQGLGGLLLRSAEEEARKLGKSLLVLDAVTGADGARLYERHGWIRVGDIPRFALMPDGPFCGTTYYYRDLSRPPSSGA